MTADLSQCWSDGGYLASWTPCDFPERPPDKSVAYHHGCRGCIVACEANAANATNEIDRERRLSMLRFISGPWPTAP